MINFPKVSVRAEFLTRRTYNRPIDEKKGIFETWHQTIDRVIKHQKWLWERQQRTRLSKDQKEELEHLRNLMLQRKASLSGRTLWLGGTEVAKRRESCMFNCAFIKVETVHDIVDVLWLLLQGCGVGFQPVVGTLNGFMKPITNVKVIRTKRTGKGGKENNEEIWNAETKTWTIQIGDSAEAWAKSIGKIIAGNYPADTLILDFSNIRPAGIRLSGYGWISSGDSSISVAYESIVKILSKKTGQHLSRIDILDIINWLGTILSSRRSSEIAIVDYGQPEWENFARAKKDFWLHQNEHRQQSNNSIKFYQKPSQQEMEKIFNIIMECGGSEPGLVNGAVAQQRAPWFSGLNPCGEILLANKSFCNLTEIDLSKFKGDAYNLHRAVWLIARANYRQTLVNLDDGILQRAWHENNQFLRLCGVGLTGIVSRPEMTAYDYRQIRNMAVTSAYSMADELGTQKPKNVTTIKPSGTLSKIMDTPGEGAHKPMGRYIFNSIKISSHDLIVDRCKKAGYDVINSPNPTDVDTNIIKFPVEYTDVQFDIVDGKEINLESAIDQLNRYKFLMDNYVDHNCSVTISYDKEEVPEIITWLLNNWDSYVGVSFLYRTDPTKTARDLGYDYLPQQVVTKQEFDEYVLRLSPISFDNVSSLNEILDNECEGGSCPVR